jgi:transposase
LILLLTGLVERAVDERAELRGLLNSSDVPATVATRARIVLWHAEKRSKKEVAALVGVSRPTVDLWLDRYGCQGVGGLLDRRRGAAREQVSGAIRARILAARCTSPPAETGLSHWSSREMAAFIERSESVYVAYHYVAKLWRENGLRPHRQGTFKLSRDPEFAAKIANIVGLYLHPPGGAVVLRLDEKTQIQALDRTQPLLPITFDAMEKRTHDYVRHGTTNLFAALNVANGEVMGSAHRPAWPELPGVPQRPYSRTPARTSGLSSRGTVVGAEIDHERQRGSLGDCFTSGSKGWSPQALVCAVRDDR